MASVTVKTPAGADAGTVELDEATFGIEPNVAGHAPGRHRPARRRACRHPEHQDPRRGRAAAAPSRGGRRAPAVPVRARPARRTGVGGGVALGPKPRSYAQKHPQEDDQAGAALGPVGPGRRGQGRRGRRLGLRHPDDQGRRGRARPPSALEGRVARGARPRRRRAPGRASATSPSVHILDAGELNTYDVLVNDYVVFTRCQRCPPVARGRRGGGSASEGPPRRHHPPGREREELRACSTATSTRSSSHPDASKPEIRDAVEAIFGVKVTKVNTLNRKGKRKRNRRTGTSARVPTPSAPSSPSPRATASSSSRGMTMALRKRKPTSPGRRFQTVSDFAEITKTTPEKSLLAPKTKHGRPQLLRPQDRPPPRRRPQAAVPHRRLPSRQGRRARQGRGDRVRPEPQLPHRAAALPRRREALHPRPDRACRSATCSRAARAPRSAPATPCRCATSRSAPRCTTSSSSPAAAARWPAAPAPAIQLVAKEGDFATLRLPSTEMRRVPIDCRATVGEVGNAEARADQDRQGRPQPLEGRRARRPAVSP